MVPKKRFIGVIQVFWYIDQFLVRYLLKTNKIYYISTSELTISSVFTKILYPKICIETFSTKNLSYFCLIIIHTLRIYCQKFVSNLSSFILSLIYWSLIKEHNDLRRYDIEIMRGSENIHPQVNIHQVLQVIFTTCRTS